MSAGTFKGGRIVWQRAWKCPTHHTYWYDDGVCRICGAKGEPEKLPDDAVMIEQPSEKIEKQER